jgi:hypothetical protein
MNLLDNVDVELLHYVVDERLRTCGSSGFSPFGQVGRSPSPVDNLL